MINKMHSDTKMMIIMEEDDEFLNKKNYQFLNIYRNEKNA